MRAYILKAEDKHPFTLRSQDPGSQTRPSRKEIGRIFSEKSDQPKRTNLKTMKLKFPKEKVS